MTIEKAADRYLDDMYQQNCAEETLTKLETLFRKQLVNWAKRKGLLYLVEVTLDHSKNFAKTGRTSHH